MFVEYGSDTVPVRSGRQYFISTDQIGTPIHIEDGRARTVWHANVDPYGITHLWPGNTIDFGLRFPGHQEDAEIGLFCNRFRHYSPTLGRYLQSDPLGIAGGKNLYAYPANPLTTVDLFGLSHPPNTEGPEGAPKTGPDEENTGPRPLTAEEEAFAQSLVAATRARARDLLDQRNKGPVLTGVVDPRFPDGGPFFAQNTGIPDDLHPVLQARLNQHNDDIANGRVSPKPAAGDPGAHSEINALDQALKNRDQRTGQQSTESDLNDMIAHNVNLKNVNVKRM